MIVHIDHTSPIPPYEQLRAQVAASILAGRLSRGYQLPPIRQLARDLAVAPGTVARAYRELEAAGLVETGGRRGTRVAARPANDPPAADQALAAAAREYARAAREADAGLSDALGVVYTALAGALVPEEGTRRSRP